MNDESDFTTEDEKQSESDEEWLPEIPPPPVQSFSPLSFTSSQSFSPPPPLSSSLPPPPSSLPPPPPNIPRKRKRRMTEEELLCAPPSVLKPRKQYSNQYKTHSQIRSANMEAARKYRKRRKNNELFLQTTLEMSINFIKKHFKDHNDPEYQRILDNYRNLKTLKSMTGRKTKDLSEYDALTHNLQSEMKDFTPTKMEQSYKSYVLSVKNDVPELVNVFRKLMNK